MTDATKAVIPDDVRRIVEQFSCDYAPHLREMVQLDIALAIAADREARDWKHAEAVPPHAFADAIAWAEAAGLTVLVNGGRMQPREGGDDEQGA